MWPTVYGSPPFVVQSSFPKDLETLHSFPVHEYGVWCLNVHDPGALAKTSCAGVQSMEWVLESMTQLFGLNSSFTVGPVHEVGTFSEGE